VLRFSNVFPCFLLIFYVFIDSFPPFNTQFNKVEIDEYRDYEKAIGALKEGIKCLGKETAANNSPQTRDMARSFEKRISMIETYVAARNCAKRDPQKMVELCEELLQDPMLEE